MRKPIDKINLSVKNGKGKVITNGSVANILIDFGKVKGGGAGGTTTRIAYANGDAPDASSIDMFLDTDTTGEAITAEALIVNGSSLMYSMPFLRDGDPVFVTKINIDGTPTWFITGVPFNGAMFRS